MDTNEQYYMNSKEEDKEKKNLVRRLLKPVGKTILYTSVVLGIGIAGDHLNLERKLVDPIRYHGDIIEKDTPPDILSYQLEIKRGKEGLELYLVNENTQDGHIKERRKIHRDGNTRRFPDELKETYISFKNKVENSLRRLYYYSKIKLEEKKQENE